MLIFYIWLVLSIICGVLGSERNIGGVGAFFVSLLLSPLIGFIVVVISDKKKSSSNPTQTQAPWKLLIEKGDIEKFKGNKENAIDQYKEALFHLTQAVASPRYQDSDSQNKLKWRMNEVNAKIKEAERL